MIVNISNEQSTLPIPLEQVEVLVKQVLLNEQASCDEVNIYFVDTPTICQLHQDYFDDPSPTDCISFPLDDEDTTGYQILGEVFVCPETALSYAKEHAADPYDETSLYIVHGLLHLLGYDDMEEEDELPMRAAENSNMEILKKLNKLLRAPT